MGQHRAAVPVGPKVKGKVVNLVPYGAFVELEPGVEGLVHVTELSWTKRIANPPTCSSRTRKSRPSCSASTARSRRSPSASASSKPIRGTRSKCATRSAPRSKGKIRNLTSYGAFIELEEGLDGMIHVSDMSWTRKINHPSEVLKKGDEVEAVVLEVDKANQRIASASSSSTTIRGRNIDQLYKVGDLVTGKVTKLASFGAFIGLQHDIDGLVHISQISEERVDKIKNVLKVGQEVTARVIKIDKATAASVSRSRPPTTTRTLSAARRRRSTPCGPAKTWSAWPTPSTPPRKSTGRAIPRERNNEHRSRSSGRIL